MYLAQLDLVLPSLSKQKNVCQYADGAIVGSAIVKIVAEYGKESVPYVGEYVKSMKDAIR